MDLYVNEWGEKIVKEVFSYNIDETKTAYINWRTKQGEPIQSMNVIADGYFQSALLLAEQCLRDNTDRKADAVIFPMLFSVNHGIELYVKSICWSLNILLGNNGKYKGNHNIQGLWDATKQKVKEFGFGYGHEEDEFNKMIVELELYIDELDTKIMKDNKDKAYYNIDFSRYPINNKDEYHFYMKTYDNEVVDLENFVEVFNKIHNSLSCLAGYYYGLVEESWQNE